MSRFVCADEAASGERSDGEHSPTPSADAQTERLRSTRSVVRKRSRSSHTTSDSLVASYFAIEYFLVVDLQVLICVFAFPSPAAKMPWTSASGDDAAVEQTVPSTTVDPSSADVNKTIDAGKMAVIAKPARKFGIKGITLIRAPA